MIVAIELGNLYVYNKGMMKTLFSHIKVDRDSRVSLQDQLVRQVDNLIETGKLRDGDRLPTLKEWADDTGVSMNTVRNCMAVLEQRGRIRKARRRGIMVNAKEESPASPNFDMPEATQAHIGIVRIEGEKAHGQPLAAWELEYVRMVEMNFVRERHRCTRHRIASGNREELRAVMDQTDALLVLTRDVEDLDNQAPELFMHPRPLVIYGYHGSAAVSTVNSDWTWAMNEAVRRLCDLGHKQIALASLPDRLHWVEQREEDFRACCRRYGLASPQMAHSPHAYHFRDLRVGARASAGQLMDSAAPPTAIIGVNDAVAIGILDGLQELGIDVPGEVSVIGIDNVEPGAQVGLTSVGRDALGEAKASVDLLVELLNGGRQDDYIRLSKRPLLVERMTSGRAKS